MHRLSAVAHGGRPKCDVLNEAEHTHTVFRVFTHGSLQIFADVWADFFVAQILLSRHRHHQSTRDIFC